MNPDDLVPHLADVARSGRLATVVGAGLSLDAGLPSWGQLFAPLAAQLGPDAASADYDLPTLAEAYEATFGRNSLLRHLRDELWGEYAPTAAHRALARLTTGPFVTTNYDTVLDRALQDAFGGDQSVDVVASDVELAYLRGAAPELLKLCGRLDDPESIIVTRRDFATAEVLKPRVIQRFRSILESKEVLVLGSSLRDPVFNAQWDLACAGLGIHKPVGWVVALDASDVEIQRGLSRGLRLVPAPRTGTTAWLADWLTRIRSGADARAEA